MVPGVADFYVERETTTDTIEATIATVYGKAFVIFRGLFYKLRWTEMRA